MRKGGQGGGKVGGIRGGEKGEEHRRLVGGEGRGGGRGRKIVVVEGCEMEALREKMETGERSQ